MNLGILLSVALLGPEGSPVLARIQRNFADEHVVTSVAVSCTRSVIQQAAAALEGNTIICTDGDVVTVWKAERGGVKLVEAIPISGTDDRTLEIVAARVTLAAREEPPEATQAPQPQDRTSIVVYRAPADDQPPAAMPAPPRTLRLTSPLILSAGPTLFASSDGASPGFQLQADIGVGRIIALTPWVGIIPAARHIAPAEASAYGTADYRPTLFGCGINVPVLRPSSFLIPRIGAGYALLWIHTWPEHVGPAGIANQSEDLFAPVMYVTAALSARLSEHVRIVLDGMFGAATGQAVIRVGGLDAAKWGIPLENVGLRAEYVLP